MHSSFADHCRSYITGHSVVRLLIVSYFVALALGVIEGTDVSVLVSAMLPQALAGFVASGVVLALSVSILVGWHRRTSALVLALALFWSSYVAMMGSPDAQLGAFWRDLALIGALVLSYGDGQVASRKAPEAQSAVSEGPVRSRISQAFHSTRSAISRPSARSAKAESEEAELYRKDLDIVRAS